MYGEFYFCRPPTNSSEPFDLAQGERSSGLTQLRRKHALTLAAVVTYFTTPSEEADSWLAKFFP